MKLFTISGKTKKFACSNGTRKIMGLLEYRGDPDYYLWDCCVKSKLPENLTPEKKKEWVGLRRLYREAKARISREYLVLGSFIHGSQVLKTDYPLWWTYHPEDINWDFEWVVDACHVVGYLINKVSGPASHIEAVFGHVLVEDGVGPLGPYRAKWVVDDNDNKFLLSKEMSGPK